MSYSSDQPGLQNQLPFSVDFDNDPEKIGTQLNQLWQRLTSTVNAKTDGLYVLQEKINSNQYFKSSNVQKYRTVYRMVVNFGALPNATAKAKPHNIRWNNQCRLVQAYGAATDPAGLTAYPIPNENINLQISQTSVIVTTTSDLTSYTDSTIVIEYTKEA